MVLLKVFFPLLLVGLVWGNIFPRPLPYNGEHRSDSKTLRAVPHTRDFKQKSQEKPTTAMPVTEKQNSTQKLPLIQTLEVKERKCGKCARKAYCNWRTGKCRCRYGYKGNGKVKCWMKISSKICGRCGKGAICHKKSRKCRCRKGYRGYPWWRCWKTNICGRCGKGAICHKKSRKCRCRKGYRGYPRWRCWKKRKCGKCGRKAYCHWRTGKCRCRYGYWGNAKVKCWRKLSWFRVYKAVVCERKTRTIRCGRGRVLHVYYAKYGRDNKGTCYSKSIKVTKCSAKGATAIIKKKCNGKRKCALTSNNSVFGDPCVGTYKFLRVFFRCKRGCSKNAFYNRGRCHCQKGFKWTGRTCRRKINGRGKGRSSQKQKQSKERDIEEIDGDSSEVVKREAEGEELSAPMEQRRGIVTDVFNAENQDQSFNGEDAVDSRHRRAVDKRDGAHGLDSNGEISDLAERDVLQEEDNVDDGLSKENVRNIREAVEKNIQDTSEVKLVRERRVYCGKFGRERNGRCKCNRGFCFRGGRCRGGGCHNRKRRGEKEISNEE